MSASDAPRSQAIFPQYKYPQAKHRYAEIASHLNLGGNTDEEKVICLVCEGRGGRAAGRLMRQRARHVAVSFCALSLSSETDPAFLLVKLTLAFSEIDSRS
jgi:hypothetical protein